MKNSARILSCLLLAIAGTATAQTKVTISQALDFWTSNAEKEIVAAAEAMPAGKYSFVPSGAGFAGVRSFGQQVKHLAANNYRMAAYIVGQKPAPYEEAETGPDDVQSKAEIVQYVKGSFAALHRANAVINEENMLEPIPSHPNPKQSARVQFSEDAVAHSYDHYGQMVEYLRMNGIIPPSSRK